LLGPSIRQISAKETIPDRLSRFNRSPDKWYRLAVFMLDTTCLQREVHLKEYRKAVRAYGEAVLCLDADLTTKVFELTHRRAEQARAAFDRARKALKEHETSHGCQPTPLPIRRIS
jgi:hypothetical protein